MNSLGISILPHITNALMVTSIFSAGNTYTYCATRSLYGLALEGRAPRVLRKCTRNGVPIYCFCVIMCFPLLSFPQLGNGSSKVLTWLINLITAGGVIDYIVMSVKLSLSCTESSLLISSGTGHLHLLLQGLQGPGTRPPQFPLLWLFPAVLRLHRRYLDDSHCYLLRLLLFHPMERRDLLLVLRYVHCCTHSVCSLEVDTSYQVREAT